MRASRSASPMPKSIAPQRVQQPTEPAARCKIVLFRASALAEVKTIGHRPDFLESELLKLSPQAARRTELPRLVHFRVCAREPQVRLTVFRSGRRFNCQDLCPQIST